MSRPKAKPIVVGSGKLTIGETAERDVQGKLHLEDVPMTKMGVGAGDTVSDDAEDNMFEATFTRLYGKMSWNEKARLFWLAATLFFIIGGYWLLRSIKDPIISTISGVESIPKAKMLSVVVVTFGVAIYNELYDRFEPHQLFYIIGGFYTVLFGIIGLMLMHPVYGIDNTDADPSRLLGWVSYCAIESFGSIGVTNFWAFANSVYDLERAKRSYGLLIACAQIGSVAGPTLVTQAASIGIPGLYFCGAACMGGSASMVFLYVQRFGTEKQVAEAAALAAGTAGGTKPAKKEKAGMLEGLYIIGRYTYVQGITAVSCIFMVEVTILDYAMKVLAKAKFEADHPGDPVKAVEAFAEFMGFFGQATNTLSFCLSLLGTSFVIRSLGLRTTLLLFPTLLLGAGALVYLYPSLELLFVVMLALKALSYALNNPCKELLYQPTSKAVKFKAKSWIDIFGQRGAKALGSVVTNFYADSAAMLLSNGMVVSMALSGGLLYVSNWIGGKFDQYTEAGYVVGADAEALAEQREAGADEPEVAAEKQTVLGAEGGGTSCAVDDNDNDDDDDDDDDEGDDVGSKGDSRTSVAV
jgi:AAA family ATP:ADP antiporter